MKKVLIVEDQKEIRELLEEIFTKGLGFKHVTFACDGLEGFAETCLQKFDLICTDHSMPFYNGGDLICAIRNKEGLNQHTPVILISGLLSELPRDIKKLDSVYFLEKPIDFTRFTRYVRMAMLEHKSKMDVVD